MGGRGAGVGGMIAAGASSMRAGGGGDADNRLFVPAEGASASCKHGAMPITWPPAPPLRGTVWKTAEPTAELASLPLVPPTGGMRASLPLLLLLPAVVGSPLTPSVAAVALLLSRRRLRVRLIHSAPATAANIWGIPVEEEEGAEEGGGELARWEPVCGTSTARALAGEEAQAEGTEVVPAGGTPPTGSIGRGAGVTLNAAGAEYSA